MSGRGVIQASPVGVPGTYGGQDARGALFGNVLPGLFAAGDFAVSQRATPNMSVEVAQGQAIVTPTNATHQNAYLVRRTNGTTWNTSTDGAITWTAADPSNPRIDLVCLEVRDTDMDSSGVYQGNIRVVDGTANAGATHQLEAAFWPAIPTGCVPIAAVRVPNAATTLTTANITNLNPIAGGRSASSYTSTASTITSATYARPDHATTALPDFSFVYVPSTSAIVRLGYKAHWKISVASGTQAVTAFVDGNQIKDSTQGAAPAVVDGVNTLIAGTANTYRHLTTSPTSGFISDGAGAADSSDVTTGQIIKCAPGSTNTLSPIEIFGLSAGWHLIEVRFKTSANTLTVRERRIRAEVIG